MGALGEMEWWPVSKVTTDIDARYVQVYKDHWWATDGAGNVGMFRSSHGSLHPQCNKDRSIMEKLHPDNVLLKIGRAFSPIRIEDYDH